jgi:hypothetical protein
MRIGDVNIVRIPPSQHVNCQNGCTAVATSYRNGIPYCADCLLEEQQKAWKNEVSFVNPEGDHFGVVRQFSAEKK